MMNEKKIFIITVFFILFSVFAVFSNQYYQIQKRLGKENEKNRILLEKRKADWLTLEQSLSEYVKTFDGEAGIVIMDLQYGWDISFNKDKLFPSASIVKIPIMVSCFYAIRDGILGSDSTIRVRSMDKTSGSGVLKNMPAGKEINVSELLELMITRSDNNATNILIERLGFDYFNKSFKSYGVKNTNLSRNMVDLKARNRGIENYTTAEDIALVLKKIYYGETINREISQQCLDLLKGQKINDRIPRHLPAEAVVAHKTGLERFVCHDAGIVYTPHGDFVICALIKHSKSTSRSAKEFIANVAKITYRHFDNRQTITDAKTFAVAP
ncbi:MAG: class A beta-lactamase-related serine hydrolase [Candidatus Ratteibacteria bacterium]|nr:class A beta-lactamase-related serine hydrolase [Candidatus Ratteibacteria bacterium]